jgi:hypothetical protein
VTYGQLMGAQNQYNLELSGGDVIYVPAARRQILVLGSGERTPVLTTSVPARVAQGPLDRLGDFRDPYVPRAPRVWGGPGGFPGGFPRFFRGTGVSPGGYPGVPRFKGER